MGVLDTIRGLFGGRGGADAPEAAPPPRRSEFMRGNRGLVFAGWRPALRETHDDVAVSWEDAAARATDVIQNSGWITGAIEQATADTVGTGLRLDAKPDAGALGLDEKSAQEWAKLVEGRFPIWANDPIECDVEGRRTFGQMQGAAYKHWFATGEIVAELPWRERPGRTYGTKVRVIPAFRLGQKTEPMYRVQQGVRMDRDGMPVGYFFRVRDPFSATEARNWNEVEVVARDRAGRPRVVHVFDGLPGQVRGITPLVSGLRVAKQFDQLADATLMASIIQSVFAASVEADAPTEEMLQALLTPAEQAQMASSGMSAYDAWFEAQSGWYDRAVIDTGINGRLTHLFPGQKLNFHGANTPAPHYKDFSLHLLRELARCIGLTYEATTGDYQGVTFSSIRMATGSIYEVAKVRRTNVVAPFCQPAYEAWLEEEIDAGRVPLPGGIAQFQAHRSAIARAAWKGSPKPQPDDKKTAEAHAIWKQMGVVPDEFICADLGLDVEDVYAARAREMALRKALGLPEPPPPATPGGGASKDREDEDE